MEKMTPRIFNGGMGRLERIFNRGTSLEKSVRTEYFTALCYEKPRIFDDAIQAVIETFKPYPSEPFPSVATIKIAMLRVIDEDEDEVGYRLENTQTKDTQELDYCQRCRKSGLYLDPEGKAYFCDCEKGRLRQAAWGVRSGDSKRKEKIQRSLDRLPLSSGPVHGLRERNPAGFWELTKEEHEKWMTAKRAEISEIDERIKDRPSRKKGVVPPESIKRLVEEKIRQVRSNMSSPVQKSDEGLEDGPFERRDYIDFKYEPPM